MSACARTSDRAGQLALAAAFATFALTGSAAAEPAGPPTAACGPSGELGFVCGAENPEDLAVIPGTRWLIATGFAPGAGLKLVDTRAKTLRPWYRAEPTQVQPDRKAYAQCMGPPDPMLLNIQGLHLRSRRNGALTLYAANHGGREAIEVFAVDAKPPEPRLTWIGCLPMPDGYAANSVSTYPDGTVLATVLTRPGTTITDYVKGGITGGVYQWAPGDAAFRLLPGTELPGDNGIETSRDGKQFYVVAFGWHSIVVYSRADTRTPLKRVEAPDFMPDNIHWDGDRLLAAGMRLDEPACGGRRQVIDGVADMMFCHRGYVAAEFDPAAGRFRTLTDSGPNPAFNAVSTAVSVGDELWFGAFRSDRIAYRRLTRQTRAVHDRPTSKGTGS
jgi:hypothetical protein